MASLRSWVSDHKLTTAGTFGASVIGASIAYTRGGRLIRSRFTRALTVAALSGWAVKHYYFDGKRGMGDNYVYPPEWSEAGAAEGSEERWSW